MIRISSEVKPFCGSRVNFKVMKKSLQYICFLIAYSINRKLIDMIDRRGIPRIKFAKRSDFAVTLILKRFFLRDKKIVCILRDLSDGGALLLVEGEYAEYIAKAYLGQKAHIVSESSGISFRLKKKGKILRIIEDGNQVSVAVVFSNQPRMKQI